MSFASTTWPTSTALDDLGLDVGKGEHHACALDASGKRLHDKQIAHVAAELAMFAQISDRIFETLGRS